MFLTFIVFALLLLLLFFSFSPFLLSFIFFVCCFLFSHFLSVKLNLQLRQQSGQNIHHIVNGNVHVCNQISQLIHGTNYPQRHDKVKVLKTCINNVSELLRMWKFADRTKKKRHSTALVLHKLLARLEQLKNQIDQANVEDLPALLAELDTASTTVRTQNFEERWKTNIMMLIDRYKGTITERMNS